MKKLRPLLILILLLTGFSGVAYAAPYSIYNSPANLKVDSFRTLPATNLAEKSNGKIWVESKPGRILFHATCRLL
jgi:hypothetical protein